MKKLPVLLVLMYLAVTSYSQPLFKTIRGNGRSTTQERNLKDFDQVHSAGSFDVVITNGNAHAVKVEAEENLQEAIEVVVQNKILKIRSQKGYNVRPTTAVRVYVTVPSLRSVQLSGSGNVKSENQLQGGESFSVASSGSGNVTLDLVASSIEASVSGSGNLALSGKTKELDGRISGSGNIRAKQLQSAVTSIKISGSGNAEVVATEKLNSKIAGSGEVLYWGNAAVESKISGSGKVRRKD